ncbi:hypothetical protein GCK72_018466 [Caenorhabditis remanei]|uniref:BPTI/Kunitz inhibitor domain-containing protein n=1 Tax=Caenorhabditis remanei TaxID=31234 RepID=A0A6A5GBW3_CAERE|nr:hypothetical protein GCK72_018466 [Caenorhabditis remanei]KAF1751912.1 hypothetical protein GCK72_018466 [Caenorhabditis remanei]
MIRVLLLLSVLVGIAASQNICSWPVDLGGNSCSASNSSIRFFYDVEFKRCLPFLYNGCGGNENNFPEMRLCRQRCTPLDQLVCPANTPSIPNKSGSTGCGACDDPTKSFCHKGPNGAGICCSSDAQRKVNEDRELTCSNGKKKYTIVRGDKERVYIGKSCDHKFCPDGYDCQKGNYYAFCCAK